MPLRAPSFALLAALIAGVALAGCTVPEESAPAAPAPRVPETDEDADGAAARAAADPPAAVGRSLGTEGPPRQAEGEGDAAAAARAPLAEREGESPMRLYVTADAAPAEACRRAPVNVTVAVEDAAGAPVEGAAVNATWRTGTFGARVGNATDEAGVAKVTRAAPARTGALVPIEVEATEGRRYGAAVTFVTVADCGVRRTSELPSWLDEPWGEDGPPLPPGEDELPLPAETLLGETARKPRCFPDRRNETLNQGAPMGPRCCPSRSRRPPSRTLPLSRRPRAVCAWTSSA